jgi:hypothetical protein
MTTGVSLRSAATAALVRAGLAGSLSILLLAVALWDFRLGQEDGFMRVNVLVAEIAVGIAAAICFGGAIRFINLALKARVSWYLRVPLLAKTRVLMFLQFLAMALAVYALALVIFGEPIPGSDHSILYRGWTPAPETQPEPR